MDNSGLPESQQISPQLIAGKYDVKAFQTLNDIRLDIVNFVKNGESLYIYSEHTGNGKTSWSIKLLLRYFDQIWAGNGFRIRGKFIYVPMLLSTSKDFNNPKLQQQREDLCTIDLVIWDDIAGTKLSDYDIGQLLTIIDRRIANGLANIYTGNIGTKEQLQSSVGDRLASRIWNMSTLVEFKGKDRRAEW